MARLNAENEALARRVIARFPRSRSAMIQLLHMCQEQDGWLTEEAMVHVAELLGVAPAEVLSTASFYEMFKREPVGRYCVNICTNIACQITGAWDLLEHAEERLGIKAGSTTPDGLFTLEDVECIAACTQAPAIQVNYRYFANVDAERLDGMLDDLAAGRLDDAVPPHGTLARVRQEPPPDRWAGTGSAAQAERDGRQGYVSDRSDTYAPEVS